LPLLVNQHPVLEVPEINRLGSGGLFLNQI